MKKESTNINLSLSKRTVIGKKVAGLRKSGLTPCVVYGSHFKEAVSAQVPSVDLDKVIHHVGKHTPVELDIDGSKTLAIVKEINIDPVKHNIIHVSFQAISQDEVITTQVPIRLIGLGESPAERAGLVILQAIETVEVKAKPADLPESLEILVDKLETDEDKLTIANIVLPTGVAYADNEQDLELVVANVYEPSALQAANEAAGGEAEAETIEEPTEPGEADAEATAEADAQTESTEDK